MRKKSSLEHFLRIQILSGDHHAEFCFGVQEEKERQPLHPSLLRPTRSQHLDALILGGPLHLTCHSNAQINATCLQNPRQICELNFEYPPNKIMPCNCSCLIPHLQKHYINYVIEESLQDVSGLFKWTVLVGLLTCFLFYFFNHKMSSSINYTEEEIYL